MILLQMVMTDNLCCRIPDGTQELNGDWDITICMDMKPKPIWEDILVKCNGLCLLSVLTGDTVSLEAMKLKRICLGKNTKNKRATLSAGIVYTLPMLVDFQAEVFTDGIVRLQLRREDIPLTKRLRGAFSVNTDKEYMLGLKYIMTRNTAFSTHYDSDMGWGLGLTLSY